MDRTSGQVQRGSIKKGSWEVIERANITSAQATVDIFWTDAYEMVELLFFNLDTVTDQTDFFFRVSINGSTYLSTSIYDGMNHTLEYDTSAVTDVSEALNGTLATIAHNIDAGAGTDEVTGYLKLYRPADTTWFKSYEGRAVYAYDDGTNVGEAVSNFGGVIKTASAVNGIQLDLLAGNINGLDYIVRGFK